MMNDYMEAFTKLSGELEKEFGGSIGSQMLVSLTKSLASFKDRFTDEQIEFMKSLDDEQKMVIVITYVQGYIAGISFAADLEM